MGFVYHMAPFSQDDTFLLLSCRLSISTNSFQPEKQQALFRDIQGENPIPLDSYLYIFVWGIVFSCGGKSME